MDDGTENIDVIDMQRAFRWNHDSCRKKRIEAWWRQLRRLCINFWMEKFSRFQEEQLLSTALDIDMSSRMSLTGLWWNGMNIWCVIRQETYQLENLNFCSGIQNYMNH
ncbi:hypothetical protein DPMN_109484 [Dreissena polymorpha]|uniref:Uncharacterized protein n=2 Tax=Dreissena polymorpha TaxID=45954 RepID=A0A9D4QM74_DREPO|nr:hypothetical protein DPMN_109484 [Dreissena polymorpha]